MGTRTAILRRSIGSRVGLHDQNSSFTLGLRRSIQGQPNFNFLPGGSAPFQVEFGLSRRFDLTDSIELGTSIETQLDINGNHRSFFNLDLSSSHFGSLGTKTRNPYYQLKLLADILTCVS